MALDALGGLMKFEVGKNYMHKDAMDVYMHVDDVISSDKWTTLMEVTWFNLGYTGHPWPVESDLAIISSALAINWQELPEKPQRMVQNED